MMHGAYSVKFCHFILHLKCCVVLYEFSLICLVLVARSQSQASPYGIYGKQIITGAISLQVHRFSSVTIIPPILRIHSFIHSSSALYTSCWQHH